MKKVTSRKGSANAPRRTASGPQSIARRAAQKAKTASRTKLEKGAPRGMTTKNKKAPRPTERVVETAPHVVTERPIQRAIQRQGFKTSEFIVYPAHGVGQIVAIEEQEVAGYKLELFVISFVKDKMTLRVPTAKIASVGMRKLADAPIVKRALDTLKGRARIKRTMWSRRAQEYEAKINSGDIVAIAEVVRDLYRSESQPEQSYSERQLYEAALDRLSREIAAVHRVTETEAVKEVEAALAKGPRRGPKPAETPEPAETVEALVEDEAA
jgi:CarD family transcriptional regulator